MTRSRPLALVTGAARGIGAGIALELAAQGFDLALTDIDEGAAADVLAPLNERGADARCFAFDLADVDSHARIVEAIVDWGGPVACLVNNAGIGSPSRGDLLDVRPDAFDRVLGVNLRGTFFFTQAVARHMASAALERPRSIVTISSVSAEMASVERGDYCISKSGLGMLTKLFALRLAALGVGVFEIRPGIIRTPMTEGVAAKYEQRFADGLVPMNRWGTADDVARAVAAVASGHINFATGTVLHVDGALSIARF